MVERVLHEPEIPNTIHRMRSHGQLSCEHMWWLWMKSNISSVLRKWLYFQRFNPNILYHLVVHNERLDARVFACWFAWLFGSFTRPTRHGLITMFSILSTRSTLTTSTTAYTRWHSCKIIGRHSLWSKNNSNNNIDVTTCENTCLGCKRVHVQYIRTTGSPLRMCSLESKIDKKSEKHAGADDRTSAPTINRRKSCAKWISGRLRGPTGWTYVLIRYSWQTRKKKKESDDVVE